MKKTIFVFGALIIALLALFKISKFSILSSGDNSEITITIIAVIFFIIGIVLNRKSLQKKIVENPTHTINTEKISELGISKREYEILEEIAAGYSNKEIADKLFVSESTVKTHISNLFSKLDAKRRTQAIQKAKEFQILS